jgi:Predicted transcriptional regulators
MEEARPAIRHLRALGLSQSEAELYLAALTRGGGDAKSLSQTSGVPYGKVYTALKDLSKRVGLLKSRDFQKDTYLVHPKKQSKFTETF